MTARRVYGEMSFDEQAKHHEAWKRIEAFIYSLMTKETKDYEVHQSIEYARKVYLAEIANGSSVHCCEQTVMRLFTL